MQKEEFVAQISQGRVSSNSKMAYTFLKDNFFGERVNEKILYSLSEAMFLVKNKKLKILSGKKILTESEVISKFSKMDKNFQLKYAVFEDLRKKGFILKSGIKYGADFSVYTKGKKPGKDHSEWLLSAETYSKKLNWKEFILKNRVANSTKKKVLIAVQDSEGNIIYYDITWKKF